MLPSLHAVPGNRLDQIWMVRAPVPSASSVAWSLGWLDEEYAAEGIKVGWVREETIRDPITHSEQRQRATLREGGNISALIDRSRGQPTRVIGLTWIDERQSIIVRPDSGIREPGDLRKRRIAIPGAEQSSSSLTVRGMSLHGVENALSLAGLTLDDVEIIEIPGARIDYSDPLTINRMWAGLDWVADGRADAVYIKGAAGAEAAEALGLVVGVDLDVYPSRLSRVNNGTPRPIIVHESLIEQHFDLVVRFLYRTLLAADWAANHLPDLIEILQRETFSGPEGIRAAYRNDFHRTLHPSLAAERIDMLRLQEQFLHRHGFLDDRVDIDGWIDPRPLAVANAMREKLRAA
ncbi:MAG TPA: ABC transporter substrate-binding protein [Sphingobium sp.]